MLVITGMYLTVEIPFSVYLIDFLASASGDNLERVEKVGRLLTGAAVAIFLVGSLVFPLCSRRLPVLTTILIAIVVAVPSVKFTYDVLKEVGEVTGKQASEEARKNAFLANISKRHLGEKGFNGIEPSAEGDWQMFVSFLPALVGGSGDKLFDLTGVTLEELAQAEAKRIQGSPAAFRATSFTKVFDNLRDSYKEYQTAGEEYRTALMGVGAQAEEKWVDFRKQVERAFRGKKTFSASERSLVRQRAKEKGLVLPRNFDPNDKKGFLRIASNEIIAEIKTEYERGITRQTGGYLPPDLTYDEFLKHKTIQKGIRKAIDLADSSVTIEPAMPDDAFEAAVYRPLLKTTADYVLATTRLKASDFTEDAKYLDRGVHAVQAVELPVLAILLSLAGSTLHLFKFTNYALKLIGHLKFRPLKLLGLPFASAAAAVSFLIAMAFVIGLQGNRVKTISAELAGTEANDPLVLVLHNSLALQPEFSKLGNALASIGIWPIFKEFTSLDQSRETDL
ncbi:hypothetical protein A8A54_21185 [Brucella pseudogrignonensis]|uniref:hypothetical protein n=1 Tax=Brucella pseudogrignonensis TaxID=419475 RepID=UPI0002B9BB4A|nr:hypothetical protein [Brucella pseudogrignonensis]ANG99082.1 hypothetical protein A8A54_21185 [Brucella pseudogrignonensis]EMG51248.1 hypothetical protein WYI_23355 [Ochrobactrum sp. CDB2]